MQKFLIICLSFCVCAIALAKRPVTFTTAKKYAESIFEVHRATLYCACAYSEQKQVDLPSCNMQQAEAEKRAHKMEWEHIVPAYYLGKDLACWNESICSDSRSQKYRGRKCCEKVDNEFRLRESDLFNLWPSVGAVNNARSNFIYAQFYPKTNPAAYNYKGCPIILDYAHQSVEPSDEAKGVVARASLYMIDHYHLVMADDFLRLMYDWNNRFPPSDWEISWEQQASSIMGNHNPYITQYQVMRRHLLHA